ncbi:MAG: hypothetical protein MUC84_11860 [Solirubrobacteraceae bacterium]|nr:hypothetical protein [Solirubrobacteraceae bacterium]
MRQGWKLACAALALALATATAPQALAAGSSGKATGSGKASYRQFTGYVTALDKSSITVEKRGKTPESRTFVKDASLTTTGTIEKNAHVTVYYRDKDGQPVAHKVVAKSTAMANDGGSKTTASAKGAGSSSGSGSR